MSRTVADLERSLRNQEETIASRIDELELKLGVLGQMYGIDEHTVFNNYAQAAYEDFMEDQVLEEQA